MPTTFNTPLAARILATVLEHPDRHNQDSWVSECGTTKCVAGWAVVIGAGKDLRINPRDPYMEDMQTRKPGKSWKPLTEDELVTKAASLLGITHTEASYLFYGTSNAEAIEWLGNKIQVATKAVLLNEIEKELV